MLTPKQARFVEQYMVDLNGKQAAIRAGYHPSRAERTASELLAQRKVSEAVAAAQADRTRRTQIDADWVLKRLALLADADLADIYGNDGQLKPISEWPDAWRLGLVAGVETIEERVEGVVVGHIRKIKISDRIKTIELIGRHVDIGAWRDKLEHTGPGGGPIITRRAEDMTDDELALIAAGKGAKHG